MDDETYASCVCVVVAMVVRTEPDARDRVVDLTVCVKSLVLCKRLETLTAM